MNEISYDDWEKLKLKIGAVVKVERIPKTENLYNLQVTLEMGKKSKL